MIKKIAVVTCAYIPDGKVEYGTPVRSVQDPTYYLSYDEDKFETLKFTLACYKHYNPGVDCDYFVIDNSSPDKSIKEIEDICKRDGFNFEKRENVGFSFGAFRYAFEKYKDKYEYFLFHEQDFSPSKDGWLKEHVDFYNSEDNIGAVGNNVEGPRSRNNVEAEGTFKLYPEIQDSFVSLDQMAFIKTDTWQKCIDKWGWRLIDWTPEGEANNIIGSATINELSFVMPAFLSGYKIKGFMNERKYVGTNGICLMDERPWEIGLSDDKIQPMVLNHVRKFHPRFKRLFNWYKNE